MGVTLSESCLKISQNPLLLGINSRVKDGALPGDSQGLHLNQFESEFQLIAEDLSGYKEQFIHKMKSQLGDALNVCCTSSELQKEFPVRASEIIKALVEELVNKLSGTVLVLSNSYKTHLNQLRDSATLDLTIRKRIGDEDTSIIGILAGFVVGAGVAGLGGAFLGGIFGDLAGGLFGEPVDKLRKRISRRVDRKVNQIDKQLADILDSPLTEAKQALEKKPSYLWAEVPPAHDIN